MPQYRVLQKSFINNALVEEGAIVEYGGTPGPNLELIEAEKPKRKKGAAAAEGESSDQEQVQSAE
jgi:hypothetical protein